MNFIQKLTISAIPTYCATYYNFTQFSKRNTVYHILPNIFNVFQLPIDYSIFLCLLVILEHLTWISDFEIREPLFISVYKSTIITNPLLVVIIVNTFLHDPAKISACLEYFPTHSLNHIVSV